MTGSRRLLKIRNSSSYNAITSSALCLSFISIWNSFKNLPRIIYVSFFSATRFVPVLFFKSSPSAIRRIISFKVINSIDSFIRRAFSHVFEKVKKTISPSFTDSYTFCTIPFIPSIIRIMTPRNHSCPNFICRRAAHTMGSKTLVNLTLFTTLRRTISKSFTKNFFNKTTSTLTFPKDMTIGRVRPLFKNSPFFESFFSQVYKFHEYDINKLNNYGKDISLTFLQGG